MPRPEEYAEEHRDQDREVPAGYHRTVARVTSVLVRRGVMRIHRGRVGRVGFPRVQAGTEPVLVTVDPVAQ